MAKLADIQVGAKVKVRRGYSVRSGKVTGIYKGKVSVAFDVEAVDYQGIPAYQRGGLFGATVAPNQVTLDA